jgi:hypothetical protein
MTIAQSNDKRAKFKEIADLLKDPTPGKVALSSVSVCVCAGAVYVF